MNSGLKTDDEVLDWYANLVRRTVIEKFHQPPMRTEVPDEPGTPAEPEPVATRPPTIEELREAFADFNDPGNSGTIEGESRFHRAAHKLHLAHR